MMVATGKLMVSIVLALRMEGSGIASDGAYVFKEICEIRRATDPAGALPLRSRVDYSIIRDVKVNEGEVTFGCKVLTRVAENESASSIVDNLFDNTRDPNDDAVTSAEYAVDKDVGLKNPFPPSIVVPMAYDLPRIGIEVFCTPGVDVAGQRKSGDYTGVSRFESPVGCEPHFTGRWSYRMSDLGAGMMRIEGPVACQAREGKVELSGWLAQTVDSSNVPIKSEGGYLLVIRKEENPTLVPQDEQLVEAADSIVASYFFEFSESSDLPVPVELEQYLGDGS